MTGFKYAFSLSAGEVKNATPPGTVKLVDHTLERTISGRNAPHDEIRLVPQPSSDPADPLNWPMWRKIAILSCMSLLPFVVNFTSATLASALPILATPIAFNPPVPFSKLSYLIAVNVLMVGAANLWWVPLANTFGRRPIILLSLLLLTLSSMWAGIARSFDSLLAARFFMGVGGAPADTVAPDVVGEVFFVHQRGRAMAIYTVFLALGSLLGGMSGGYIVASGGIPWLHWTNVILSATALVLCFFFQPETLFNRTSALDQRIPSTVRATAAEEKFNTTEIEETATPTSFKPYTFGRSLKMGTYRGGLTSKFIAPFLTLRLPGVWLVGFWYAGLVGGIVTISTMGPSLLAMPPYLWGHNVGLINIGGIVGTVLGALWTYLMADRATKNQAKRESHGFSEPEARLWTALPGLFLATTGLWIFGFCAQYPAPKMWVGLEFGIGMLAFGLMQAPSIGFNYLIEAYNAVSGDCFVAVTCFRAIIAFCWTFFVGAWTQRDGAAEPFGIFGMLMAVFSLLTIPMIIWGKRTRIATTKWIPERADH